MDLLIGAGLQVIESTLAESVRELCRERYGRRSPEAPRRWGRQPGELVLGRRRVRVIRPRVRQAGRRTMVTLKRRYTRIRASGDATTGTACDDHACVTGEVVLGSHRDMVGGLWRELGELQWLFMCDHGLRPRSSLLDVGCGAFRGGVPFVDFLEPGRYYGIDRSRDLLEAGYAREVIPAGLAPKLPRANLLCGAGFDCRGFGRVFDLAIAQSLFTHLPAHLIRLCLRRLAAVIAPGGRLFATCFEVPPDYPHSQPFRHEPGGVVTWPDRDPYHYRFQTLRAIACGLPWRIDRVGAWDHPRGQSMLRLQRRAG